MAAILLRRFARLGTLRLFDAYYGHGASLVHGRHVREAMDFLMAANLVHRGSLRVEGQPHTAFRLRPGLKVDAELLNLVDPTTHYVEQDDSPTPILT